MKLIAEVSVIVWIGSGGLVAVSILGRSLRFVRTGILHHDLPPLNPWLEFSTGLIGVAMQLTVFLTLTLVVLPALGQDEQKEDGE